MGIVTIPPEGDIKLDDYIEEGTTIKIFYYASTDFDKNDLRSYKFTITPPGASSAPIVLDMEDVEPITDDAGNTHKALTSHWNTASSIAGIHVVQVENLTVDETNGASVWGPLRNESKSVRIVRRPLARDDNISVTLRRTGADETADQALWAAIRNRTKAISFDQYSKFLDSLLSFTEGVVEDDGNLLRKRRETLKDLRVLTNNPGINLHGVHSFELLRLATDIFLTLECGVAIENNGKWVVPHAEIFDKLEESSRLGRPVIIDSLKAQLRSYLVDQSTLPYLDRILDNLGGGSAKQPGYSKFYNYVLAARSQHPALLELIWSYWHEEGMLAQTMNAIALRFQNKRRGDRDPLAELEIDPLRPLNNLLWGYLQSEYKRLTVQRRAYEYDHHYGLSLYGKAVPKVQAADTRSKFLEAFHNALYLAAIFYRQDSDTTVIADAFPLLNALKEVHLILAEGAHNQYGDLPWTARAEMLIEKWLLSRPEMRDFLRGRIMVPYPEPWMGQADAMKRLQGWTDTTVTHFHDLGVFGEQILLSVRFGDWSVAHNEENARNWARYWKPEIQGYIHGYRSVTGVDLSADLSDTRQAELRYLPPSVHLRDQLTRQTSGRAPGQITHEPAMKLPSPLTRQLPRV